MVGKHSPENPAIREGTHLVGVDPRTGEPLVGTVVEKRPGPGGSTDVIVVNQDGKVKTINDGSRH